MRTPIPWAQSIAAVILCWPLGLPSLLKCRTAGVCNEQGDDDGAHDASKAARRFAVSGIIVGVAAWVTAAVLIVTALLVAGANASESTSERPAPYSDALSDGGPVREFSVILSADGDATYSLHGMLGGTGFSEEESFSGTVERTIKIDDADWSHLLVFVTGEDSTENVRCEIGGEVDTSMSGVGPGETECFTIR